MTHPGCVTSIFSLLSKWRPTFRNIGEEIPVKEKKKNTTLNDYNFFALVSLREYKVIWVAVLNNKQILKAR